MNWDMENKSGTLAWILHRYPFGDASLILEVWTEAFGRLGLLARGARRKGGWQPGQPYWMRWGGRGELPILHSLEELPLEPGKPVPPLLLFYINELLLRLCERDDPHPALYQEYVRALAALGSEPLAYWHLRRFERRLLEHLGWAADLQHCSQCACSLSPEQEIFSQTGGGLFCTRHRPAAAKSLRKEVWQWLCGPMDQAPAPELMAELRRYLAAELQLPLGGRSLESRRLLAAYLQARAGHPRELGK